MWENKPEIVYGSYLVKFVDFWKKYHMIWLSKIKLYSTFYSLCSGAPFLAAIKPKFKGIVRPDPSPKQDGKWNS